MKNILYINTTASGGGAATVVQRLSTMMSKLGRNPSVLTGSPELAQSPALKAARYTGLHAWTIWQGLLDYDCQKSHKLSRLPLFQDADIIHLHNLHGGYFNMWSLPLLSALKPTVWTLHDMQPLTGHCAHSLDCERWLPAIGCGHCPHLKTYPSLWRDRTHQLWQDKHTIYTHSSLYLVTPSVWLQHLTEKSLLKEQPLACIPNGADTSVYCPQDKQESRRLLGFSQNALLVGGCADGGMTNPWKGGKYTLETILELKKHFPSLQFLNIGVKMPPTELQHEDWVHHIPYVHNPIQLARLYATLDLLLYPTLADNHPLVCIESLCCGTPIAGFATGGVPEIVRDGLDGLLVPTHDGIALTKAAINLLQDTILRERMSHEAAASATQRFNLELFSHRYEKVYEEALHLPRSIEKSRLSLHAVPPIVKSPAFIKQEFSKLPRSSSRERRELLCQGLACSIYIIFAAMIGFPLQLIRTLLKFILRLKQK